MVRTVKNHHHQEEEEDDEDFISRTTDGSSQKDGRRNDQKASSHRSKHSETEQRRRSKINERFQILRDLIPQNDQKRDRASFLLEVIQYIQFLQEKLQVYEGAYQGWSPEPTKLMPWRGNCGADNFADQSPPIKNGSVDEGNIVFAPALLTNVQNLVESDLNGSAGFKATDHGAARAVSMDVPLQQNTFEAEPTHTSQGSFPDVELLASQSRTQPWNARPVSSEGAIQSCTPSEMEELKMQREEASISNAYSKGLLNNLTQALGSSGVDLSQACISVQFDIRKRASSGATSTSFSVKDHDFLSPGNQATTHCAVRNGDDVCNQAHKRPRTEQNQ
ncbi:transcription factor BIM2-like isoform X1 [Cynara cardunculus var. scolymus]|uniref:transcription factor BIM2-like isoform X1 n=1 Tax=Cynara cardunculus var. scolymus TaxID=59895 RepID=UPI000D627ADC|nr:transcription factor BIM2-like isoform X1 [Cynara cardunculus var. scolymus]